MADPLQVLRDLHVGGKLSEAKIDGEGIILGDYSYNKNARTNFQIWTGSTAGDQNKEYYAVESVLFLLQHADLQHSNYTKEAAVANCPVVRLPDRRDLLAFLKGEIQQSNSIDRFAPPAVFRPVKRHLAEQKSALDAKKARKVPDKAAEIDEKSIMGSDLAQNLSFEQIIDIKKKFQKEKKKKGGGGLPWSDSLPAGGRGDLEQAMADVQEVFKRERLFRSRKSVMQSSGKSFADIVQKTMDLVKAKEHGQLSSVSTTSHGFPARPAASAGRVTGYSRFDQEQFSDVQYAGLDTKRSFGSAIDSTRGGAIGSNLKPWQMQKKPLPITAISSSSSAVSKIKSKTPIVIIPAANTSVINTFNVQSLLQEMKFVSYEARKAEGAKKEQEVLIHRAKADRKTVPYRVIDSISKLQEHDWDRVVAVFVQGPAWQFKNWPWHGEPKEIFTRIKAFHLKFKEMTLDRNVKDWGVEVLQLDRHKRHLDRAILQQFWDSLDRFMVKYKPHLRQ